MSDNNNARRAGRIRPFYILISLLFLSPTIGAGSAWAHSASKEQLSAELLDLMQVQKQIEQVTSEIKRNSMAAVKQMNLDDRFKPIADEYQAEVLKLLSAALEWESQKQVYIDAYSAALDEKTLNDVVHFMRSESGQRLIASQLAVQMILKEHVDERIKAIQPQLQALNRDLVEAMKNATQLGPPGE